MQAGWEQQDLGRLALLGSTGAVLCGSRVKAGSVNSNHKEQGLSKLQGALVHKWRKLGGRRDRLSAGCWRSHIRNLTLRLPWRARTCGRASVSSRPPLGTWPHKLMPRQQYYGVI